MPRVLRTARRGPAARRYVTSYPGGCRRVRRSRLVSCVTVESGLGGCRRCSFPDQSRHYLCAPGQGVERSRRSSSRPWPRPAFDAAHASWHQRCQPCNARIPRLSGRLRRPGWLRSCKRPAGRAKRVCGPRRRDTRATRRAGPPPAMVLSLRSDCSTPDAVTLARLLLPRAKGEEVGSVARRSLPLRRGRPQRALGVVGAGRSHDGLRRFDHERIDR